ncbi:deoxyribose-phosphate aldolase [Methylobacterium dankookense]|uniref:Deoxyribose-phosphate aldolase n=1 Tax=Methylobacterium dankookense TaxID=560405 RepID=A0A564FTL7_9HYPH|nr:deoxyribose-phosphate aldolase [Methylobacterium dankookense]GJD56004.1 Deoxyribose-phosphate aldolase [Methylobacterium dankookense]VUF11403.1 Deoxyribose-phosphate aldolase [Methylobacterium dankookense]
MTNPTDPGAASVARRALPLLDLTDLGEGCTPDRIAVLCRDARDGGVAAICVWPAFVKQGAALLAGSGIKVATVVNFPDGGEDAAAAAAETKAARAAGADEIDLVLPYRAVMRGDAARARALVAAVRAACGPACLKVILETGSLETPERVAQASLLALEEGADFLKTSTGKSPVSATPEAAGLMLAAIAASGKPAGLKVSGGLRRVADAAAYLAIADALMGPGWATPKTFRLGASSLYGALMDARGAAA